MPGGQKLFLPVSLYFTFTLSPEVKEFISSIFTIRVSPLSRCICTAQFAHPPLIHRFPFSCFIASLLFVQDKAKTRIIPKKEFFSYLLLI